MLCRKQRTFLTMAPPPLENSKFKPFVTMTSAALSISLRKFM